MPDTPPSTSMTTPQGPEGEPVTPENSLAANQNVMKELLGEPSKAPVEPTPPPEPKPVEDPVPETPPTEPSPKPPKPDASEPEVPVPPSELFEDPTPPPDDDFDPNEIDVEQVPEPMRPNFAKMRDKLNGTMKDLATIRAERDALQERIKSGDSADPETLKTLQEERDALLDKIGRLSLEQDPRFVAKYETQKKPIVESLKTMLSSFDIEGLDVDGMIQFASTLAPADRMQFVQGQIPEELQSAAMGSLLPMFAQFDMIESTRRAELENHTKVLQEMGTQQSEADKASLAALRDNVKSAALKKVAERELLLRKVEGNEAWNKTVDKLMESVNEVFTEQPPEVHAEALVMSRLAPMYKMMFLAERQRAATFENALKSRNIALPGIGTRTKKADDAPESRGPMTAEEAAKRVSSRLG